MKTLKNLLKWLPAYGTPSFMISFSIIRQAWDVTFYVDTPNFLAKAIEQPAIKKFSSRDMHSWT